MKIADTITSGKDAKKVFIDALQHIEPEKAYVIKIKEGSKRTLEQNKKMWAMLHDVAKQVRWHDQKLSAEDWKHVFTASIKGQRIVPGLDGELVVLGVSTSNESIKFMSDMIELMYSFGSEQFVMWSDPADKAMMAYPEAMG